MTSSFAWPAWPGLIKARSQSPQAVLQHILGQMDMAARLQQVAILEDSVVLLIAAYPRDLHNFMNGVVQVRMC